MILAHKEDILTEEEQKTLQIWQVNYVCSILFVFMIQLPLTAKYTGMMKRDPPKNAHLRLRILAMATFSIGAYLFTSSRADILTDRLAKKYLSDLSDFEIDNF